MKKIKSKLSLAASIFEIIMGVLAMISFFYLYFRGEDMSSFWITLFVAISLTLTGIVGVYQYRKLKIIENQENQTENEDIKK